MSVSDAVNHGKYTENNTVPFGKMSKETFENIAWMALTLLVIGIVAIALTTTLEQSTMTRSDFIDYWTNKEVVTQFTNPKVIASLRALMIVGGALGVASLALGCVAYAYNKKGIAKGLLLTAAAAIAMMVISMVFSRQISTSHYKYTMTPTGFRWEGYFTNVRLNLSGLHVLKKVAITFIAVGGAALAGALGARFHASKKRESQLHQQKMAHDLLEDAFTAPPKVPSN